MNIPIEVVLTQLCKSLPVEIIERSLPLYWWMEWKPDIFNPYATSVLKDASSAVVMELELHLSGPGSHKEGTSKVRKYVNTQQFLLVSPKGINSRKFMQLIRLC